MIKKQSKLEKVVNLKVEIRKLPSLLNKDDFQQTLKDFKNVKLDYFKGKLKEKEKLFSRCYIYFQNDQEAENFIKNYTKIFCDEKGQYYKPQVQFALNQNLLEENKKKNPLENTYLNSQEYKNFLEGNNQVVLEPVSMEEIERKPGQQIFDEKNKKFEKIKTAIVAELEKEHEQERKRREAVEKMQQNVITISKEKQKIFVN